MSERVAFSDLPARLQAAVTAYDEARRRLANTYTITGPGEPAMSDANKATIAPMIEAAVMAYAATASPAERQPSPRDAIETLQSNCPGGEG